MNATLKNESPEGDTDTEKNPRFVPEGRWRMSRPSGTGFFTKVTNEEIEMVEYFQNINLKDCLM